jgi:hypothetical protein
MKTPAPPPSEVACRHIKSRTRQKSRCRERCRERCKERCLALARVSDTPSLDDSSQSLRFAARTTSRSAASETLMAAKAALRAASGADCMVVAAARARLGKSTHDTRGGRMLRLHAPKPLFRLHMQANMKGTGSAVLAGLRSPSPSCTRGWTVVRHSVQSPTHGNSQHHRPRTQKWWPYSLRKLKECAVRSLHNEMNERKHQPVNENTSARG